MMTHLLALLGLVGLCAGWMLFQIWLSKQDPSKKLGYRPGCGSCGNGSCEKRQ